MICDCTVKYTHWVKAYKHFNAIEIVHCQYIYNHRIYIVYHQSPYAWLPLNIKDVRTIDMIENK